MQRFIITMGLAMTLFSCVSPTIKNEIKSDNWFAVGEYDADHGYIEKSKKSLHKMSVKFSGTEPDYAGYLAGYEQSLRIYCKPNNAYILGVTGKPYRNVCDRYPRGWAFYQDWISGRKSRAGSMF